jgi:hypothetical protein
MIDVSFHRRTCGLAISQQQRINDGQVFVYNLGAALGYSHE